MLILLFGYLLPTTHLHNPQVGQDIYFEVAEEAYEVCFLKG